MKKLLLASFVFCISVLVFEGILSLARKGSADTSLTYKIAKTVQNKFTAKSVAPTVDSISRSDQSFLANYILNEKELLDRKSQFLKEGVVLGNTPYFELATDKSRITLDDPVVGLRHKPNKVMTTSRLRSLVFKSFDPVSMFFLGKKGLSDSLNEYFLRYAIYPATFTTDENGYRTTVPLVDADDIVVLVGSSPCLCGGMDDDKTLSSLLQQSENEVRFINACIGNTKPANHIAMLGDLLQKYSGRIKGVIYTPGESLYGDPGTPKQISDEFGSLLDKNNIKYRVFIYHEYIYRTMPDIFRNDHYATLRQYNETKQMFLKSMTSNGFKVITFGRIVDDYRSESRSLFAGAALYADHAHFSILGIKKLFEIVPQYSEITPTQ